MCSPLMHNSNLYKAVICIFGAGLTVVGLSLGEQSLTTIHTPCTLHSRHWEHAPLTEQRALCTVCSTLLSSRLWQSENIERLRLRKNVYAWKAVWSRFRFVDHISRREDTMYCIKAWELLLEFTRTLRTGLWYGIKWVGRKANVKRIMINKDY